MKLPNKRILLFLLPVLLSYSALAQTTEDCADGSDNDLDGFVDCFDSDCSGSASCTDFFFGNSVVCADEPTDNPNFSIRVQWGSDDQTANSHATPAVGDIDQDGTPEVLATNKQQNKYTVLDGVTGATEYVVNLSFQPENTLVIGDVTGDECAEVFVNEDKGDGDIAAFDCEGNQIWTAKVGDKVGLMGIADFNGDGTAELYYADEIRDAATGAVIIGESGNMEVDFVHGSLAVDILDDAACADCSGLELITGNEIYSINIGTGTKTLVRDMNDDLAALGETGTYHPKYYPNWGGENWSAVSVADFNLDGTMDVLMPGAFGSDYGDPTTIFFWDVANEDVKMYADPTNDHPRGTGRINIADVDGDGFLNANYVSDQKLYSLELDQVTGDLVPHWIKGIREGSSGFTGCTLFDFDGDGDAETVYRSESQLLIIDGTDGSTRNSATCISRTQEEYPIIADVDGDAASEICVTCYTSDALSFSPYSNTQFSHVRIFESDGEVWQPSRTVWNQHGYYNVNIDDDLTVPANQQNHTAIFSSVDCETGTVTEDQRPLNSFLTQSTILEADGCPSFVSPDINLLPSPLSATQSACPETSFDVTFTIRNDGDTDLSGTLPVAFYSGDPTTADGTLVDTYIHTLNNFTIGSTETITATVEGPGGDFELFIVINNSGSEPPITLGTASIPECETDNNMTSLDVTADTFTLTANVVSNNERCVTTVPDNGEFEAFFEGTIGGGLGTIYLETFDDLAVGTSSDNGTTAWSRTEANNTDFAAVSTDIGSNAFEANDTDGNVNWRSQTIDISNFTDVSFTADITASSNQEASGSFVDRVRVFYSIDGGSEVRIFNESGSFGFMQASVSGLNGSTLDIRVRMSNTGNNESYYLDNVNVSGTEQAQTGIFTEAEGFEFFWYNEGDYSTLIHQGSSFTGAPSGTYDVFGLATASNCFSDTLTLTIAEQIPEAFTVIGTEVSPLTDCVTPDGEAAALVQEPDGTETTTGYNFTWFNSTDTSTPIATGTTLSNANAGTYLIRAISEVTGCEEEATVEITTSQTPTPTPQVVSQTQVTSCTDTDTGSITVDVNGSTSGFTFEWYDGSSVGPTPDFSGTDATGATYSGLEVGFYTVVAINATSCESAPLVVEITSTVEFPSPTATETQANTSCENADGIATADADGAGTIAGFDFEWYAGENTLSENRLPAAITGTSLSNSDSQAEGLPSGTYTVVVTNSTTGCSAQTTVDVSDNFTEPTFTLFNSVDTDESMTMGSTGYMEIPQMFGTGNPVTNAVTISYWANLTASNYSSDHRVFSSGSTGENQVLLWSDNHDGLAFVVKTQGDGSRGRINSSYSATGWTQVVGTWDGTTGEMKMYANGVEIGSTTYVGTGVLINTGNTMRIGRDLSSSKKFQGEIDEVRIYDKALSAAEIVEQMCRELDGSEDGLVGYWNFNASNVSGTTIPNTASSANITTPSDYDGTAINSSDITYTTADIVCPVSTATNNTSCDAGNPNGVIDISSSVDPGTDMDTYTFSLYSGFSTSTLLASNSTGVFSGLAGGFYTVTALSTTSECITVPATVSLADVPDLPNISTSTTDDEYCVNGNGTITVTSTSSGDEPSSYTYEIFDGANTTTLLQTVNITDGSAGTTFTDLEDGTYRIRVTNDDLTCNDFVDVVVGDNTTTPTFSSSSAFDNNSCDVPRGSASVQVSGDNLATNHTFRWYLGDVVDAANLISDETGSSLDSLGETSFEGTVTLTDNAYTVVAVNATTGCVSDPITLRVNDDPLFPNISLTEVQADINCSASTGTGQLSAEAEDPSNAGVFETEPTFSFTWWAETDTDPVTGTQVGDSNTTPDTLSAGTYTVVVVYEAFECSNSESIVLSSDTDEPVISLGNISTTINTTCDPAAYTGLADATAANAVTGGSGNYTYSWASIDAPSTEIDSDGVLSGVAGGSYILTVSDTDTGCPATGTVTVTIGETLPTVNAVASNLIDNTVCDGTNNDAGDLDANGSITFTPSTTNNVSATTAAASSYTFSLATAGGTDISNGGTHNSVIVSYSTTGSTTTVTGLSGGNYVMTITDADNTCDLEHAFTINDDDTQLPVITVGNITTTDNSTCDNTVFNGQADASAANVVAGGTGDYRFEWATAATPGTVIDNDNILNDVAGGEYILTVIDDQTGCISASESVTIGETLPTINPVVSNQVDNTVCDGTNNDAGDLDANGTITFTPTTTDNVAATTAAATSYTFSLSTAGGTAIANGGTHNSVTVSYNTTGSSSTVTGLSGGNYIMTITDADNTCDLEHSFTIADDDTELPVITVGNISTTDNTTCDNTSFTGQADASAANVVAGGTGDYRFEWATDAAPGTVIDNDNVLNGVEGGDYILTVIDDQTGCISASVDVTVGETLPTVNPVVSNQVDNTVCDGTNNDAGDLDANGTITFTPTTTDNVAATTAAATSYTFALSTAGGTDIANGGTHNSVIVSYNTTGSSSTVTGLSGGNYIMTITDADNTCDLEHAFTIADDDTELPVITVGNITTSDNTTCDNTSFTGQADASAANVVAGGTGDYRFEWATAAAPGTVIDNDNVLNGVEGGDYILTVIDDQTGCISAAVDVTVGETLPTVNPVVSNQVDNTVCDGTNNDAGDLDANGSITFTPTTTDNVAATTAAATSYTFALSTAGGTAITNGGTHDAVVVTYTTTGSSSIVSGLSGGNYIMTITDADNTCDLEHAFTIADDDTELPVITVGNISTTDNTTCDNTAFNGEADASAANVVVGGTGDYRFEWATAAAPGTVIDNDNVLNGVEGGDYILTVIDDQTGCISAAVDVTVGETLPTVNPVVSNQVDNTVCDGTNNDAGDLDANGTITFTPTTTDNVAATTAAATSYTFALSTAGGTAIANGGTHDAVVVTYTTTGSSSTVTGLSGGNYIMTITDADNTCDLEHAFTIADDDTELPVITVSNITTSENITCDNTSFTGQADASAVNVVAGGTGDYRFEWATAAAPGTVIDNDNVLNGVEGGDYILTVIDDQTGCISAAVVVTVGETLPTVNPVVSNQVDNTVCDGTNNDAGDLDANGTITFTPTTTDNVAATTAAATSYTFALSTAGGTAIANGGTHNSVIVSYNTTGSSSTVTGLSGGNYIMTITDADNTCDLEHAFTIADDDTELPVITVGNITTTDNTTCDNTAFNGEADASAANVVAGGTGDYRFEWATAAAPGTVIDNDNVLNGVEGGDYILTVIDDQTGCISASVDVTVGETLPTVNPVVSNQVDNTVCDGTNNDAGDLDANGSITFTPTTTDNVAATTAAATSYTFALSTAGGTAITNGGTHDAVVVTYTTTGSSSIVSGLSGGNYIMTITDADNTCDLEHAFTIADDDTELPVITVGNISTSDNTTCDNTSFTGQADASAVNVVAGGTGDYRFEWATAAAPGTVIDNDNVLNGVEGGDYILTVIDDQTGCISASVDVTVGETLPTVNPVVSNQVDNTVCDGTNNDAGDLDANGTITFTPTTTDNVAATTAAATSYTFALSTAGGTAITNGGTHNAVVVTYTITGSSSTVTGLSGGNYIMTITDADNTCDLEHAFTIADDDTELPVITVGNITTSDNTTCDNTSFTGQADASAVNVVAGGTGDYRFEWATAAAPGTVIDNDNVLNGVEGGDYILTVIDDQTGCISASVDVTVGETLPTVNPVVSNQGDNTVCDGTNNDAGDLDANGTITFTPTTTDNVAATTAAATSYTFALSTAGGTAIANGGTHNAVVVTYTTTGSSSIVTGLSDGNYIMTITDADNTCDLEHAFTIADDDTELPVITVGNITTTDNTTCDNTAFNGEADASAANVVAGGTGDYRFEWATAAAPGTVIDNDNVLNGVEGGDYILTVIDDQTGCVSASVDVTVGETLPTVNPVVSNQVDNTVCDGTNNDAGDLDANGTITFTPTTTDNVAATTAAATSYTFALSTAGGTAIANGGTHNAVVVTYTTTGSSSIVTGLSGGNYIMTITDADNTCDLEHAFTIADDDTELPVITVGNITTTDNTTCDNTAFNGEADASAANVVAGGTGDYRFEWATAAAPGTVIDNDNVLNDVDGGDYILTVIDDQTGCISASVDVTVGETLPTVNPVVSNQVDNTVCDGTNNDAGDLDANGTITFTPTTTDNVAATTAAATSYTFALSTAGGTAIANGGTHDAVVVTYTTTGSSSTVTGLSGGNYIMTITDADNTCDLEHAFTIADDDTELPVITVGNITTSDNTTCDNTAFNGEADASAANVVAGGTGDYRFEWATAAAPGTVIDNDNVLNGVEGGDYILTVIDDQTGCISASVDVTVGETLPTVNPVVSNQGDNTVCDGTNNDAGDLDANGTITFTPTTTDNVAATTAAATSYTFALSTAGGTAIANGGTHNAVVVTYTTTGSSSIVTGLSGGNYIMTITDADNTCDLEHAFTIADDDTELPVITVGNITTTDNTTCDNTAFNGEADASAANVVAGGTGDYRFEWATAAAPGTVIDNDNVLNDVDGGDYILTVIDDQTGCISASVDVTVGETLPVIDANVTAQADNTICDTSNNGALDPDANGSITFAPLTGVTSSNNYTFALETAGGTAINDGDAYLGATVNYDDDATGSTSTTVTGLSGGNYVITITDLDNQCTNEHAFTIANDDTDVPVITLGNISITQNVTCDNTAYTGQADASGATAVTGGTGDYRYEWATAAAPGTVIDNDAILDGVAGGEYIFTVIDDQTGCVSVAQNVTIGETLPTVNPVVSAQADNTVCDGTNNDAGDLDANGTITFTPTTTDNVAATTAAASSYSYSLATAGGTAIANGSTFNSVLISYSIVGSTSTITGLSGGNYIMTITDADNTCDLEYAFTIADDDSELPEITLGNISITQNVTCDNSAYTGAADASGATAVTGGTGDYRYEWATAAAPGTVIDNDAILNNVAGGDYIFTVIDDQTGCVSASESVTIGETLPTVNPVVSAQADNTVCDGSNNDAGDLDANGTITFTPTTTDNVAATTAAASSYTFALSTSGGTAIANGATHNSVVVSYTTTGSSTIVTGLSGGNYIMTITDADNTCDLEHAFTLNDDDTELPVITVGNITLTQNVTCDNTAYTGEADASGATAVTGGTGDYRYEWATAAAPGTVIDNDAILNNVAGGDYIFTVIDDQTGCVSASESITIGETLPTVNPVVSNQVDNTVCDGTNNNAGDLDANGTITFTPTTTNNVAATTAAASSYTFALSTAGGTAIANGATHNSVVVSYTTTGSSTIVTGLSGGNYIMTITDADNTCDLEHAFTINDDDTELPVITVGNIAITPNTTCDNTSFTGQANASGASAVTGGTGDYRYEWATAATPGTVIDSDATLNGVAGGDYILTVIDDQTGCVSASESVTIGETLPVVDANVTAQVDNTVCDGTNNDAADLDANGTITFEPETGGASSNNYTFSLATSGGTTINDGDAFLGENVNYDDDATGSTSTTVTGLSGGSFVMTITDQDNQCTVEHAFSIADDDTQLPTIAVGSIAITPNTTCDNTSFTGQANASGASAVTGGTGDYRYEWATAAAPGTVIDNDATLNGVAGGEYILTVIDDQTGCVSASQNVTIGEVLPVVDANVTAQVDNTVCDGTNNDAADLDANGTITFEPETGGASSNNYTFSLATAGGTTINDGDNYLGVAVSYDDDATGSTSTVVTGLSGGNYVMTVTDQDNQCTVEHAFSIADDDTELPSISVGNIAITQNSTCDNTSFTGQANASGASAVTGGTGDYRYEWATAATPGTVIDNDAILNGVAGGEYILTVIDDQTGCVSASQNVTIGETLPVVDPNVTAQEDNTVCDGTNNDAADLDANGSITFTPLTGVSSSNNYTFSLETDAGAAIADGGSHLGVTVSYDDDATGSTATTVTGLSGGNYVMTITDQDNQCTVEHAFTIADDDTNLPTITVGNITITENVTCNGAAFTGQADASGATAVTGGTGDYRYEWATAAAPGTVIDNDAVLNGVAGGDYILTVIDDQTGCVSATTDVTIGETLPTVNPVVSAQADNTVCDGTNNDGSDLDANGTITFTPTTTDNVAATTAAASSYTFALSTAGGTSIANGGTHNTVVVSYSTTGLTSTVTGLSGGNYIMTITDADNTCDLEHAFTIADDDTDLPTITVGNITITENVTCNGAAFTGQADASGATAVTGGTGDYRYEWATAAAPGTVIDNDAVLNGVAGGDYILTVIDDQTGCASAATDVTIGETLPTVNPVVSAQADNTVCDGTNNDGSDLDANGTITFTPTTTDNVAATTAAASSYTFSLSTAGGTAIANGGTHNTVVVSYGTTGLTSTVTGLSGGNYIMTITDADNTCDLEHAFTIADDDTDLPTITVGNITITENVTCNGAAFTGQADASGATAVTGGTGDYRYEWATAAAPGTVIDNDAVLNGVAGGDYILTVIDDQTGCVSAATDVTIGETLPTVNPVVSAQADNTVCDGTNNDGSDLDANGTITFTPTTTDNVAVTTAAASSYTFALSTAGGTAIANGGTHNTVVVSYSTTGLTSTVTGLSGGNYIMTITDADNTCDLEHAFTIADDDTDLPTITVGNITITENVTCNGAAFTGQADASGATAVTGGTGDYRYEWATAAAPGTVIDNDAVLNGVAGGDYILTVIDDQTGCASAATDVTIGETLPTVNPVVSAQADNTVCDGTNNDGSDLDANGTITFTPTTTDNVAATTAAASSYTFALSTAGGTAIANGGTHNSVVVSYGTTGLTSTVTGLSGGNYIMTITDADNTCDLEHAFTIADDDTDLPIITVGNIVITPNTTCDNTAYNGQADASGATAVTGGTGDYRYEWATAAAPGTVIDSDAILNNDGAASTTGVPGGNYILTVIDDQTGCISAVQSVTVGETLPTITINTTLDRSDFGCSGTNTGQLTASVAGGSTGFTLTWYSGTSASGTAINAETDTDNIISNLSSGFYTVEVQNNTTLCTETETIEVTSQTLTLTPVTTSTDQTTCNLENGVAEVTSVTVTGTPVGATPTYKYDWFLGATQLIEVPFDNLTGTFEEGEVITFGGGATATIVVFDNSGLILASDPSGDIADDETISGGASSATADVNSSANITTTGTEGVSQLNLLTAGTYSVIVRDTDSGCETSRTDIVVNDGTAAAPTISFTNITIPSSCDAAGGSIQGSIAGGTGPFIYRWYEGSDDFTNDDDFSEALTNGQVLVGDGGGNNITVDNTTPVLGNLISGLYTLVVEDNSGCRTQATYDLPFNGIQTTTTLTVTNVDECPDNGEATVSLSDNVEVTVDNSGPRTTTLTTLETFTAAGPGGGATGIISNDDGATLVQLSISSGGLAAGDVITGDDSGNTVTVVSTASIGYTAGQADDISEYVVFLYAGDGVPADRTASYTITNSTGATLTFPYKYFPKTGEIEDGDGGSLGNNGAVAAGGSVQFTGLPSGPYTAIAQENPSAVAPTTQTSFGSTAECWTTSATEELIQEAYDPIITSFDITDDSFCDSDNGSISVTVIENADDDHLESGFTFEWRVSGSGTFFFTQTIRGFGTALTTDFTATSTTPATLAAGNYEVVITRHESTGAASGNDIGCSITSQTFTVSEDLEIHEVETASITNTSDCSPLNGSVEITGINDNGTTSTTFSDYTFQWSISGGASLFVIPFDGGSGTFEPGETITIDGGETATVVGVEATFLTVSGLSGTISNDESISGGTSGASGDVNHAADITTTSGTVGGNEITGLEAATYVVSIQDQAGSGCPSTPNSFQAIVEDETVIP
ncbi:MAG: hypothetical protein R8G66_04670, partial [Cytophagales bacterium]|nr:hypothetical protein [Cytophagales bacterium]